MSAPIDPVVETHDLTKRYRNFWGQEKVLALDHLSLSIRRGEVFGLLGPNGSGKTTTIKMLLGLVFPTSGKIQVLGESPRSVKAKARIGYLPEESYLYRFLNAEETLHFYGRLFGLNRRERRQRTDELIEQVGLAHARKRPLREYSKGMSRRIGLAQALINNPDLVLLDEPTSGMDPLGTREVKDIILRLREQGKTVLLCSHLLSDVEEVCDRIAILKSGVLEVSGPVEDLLSVGDEIQIRLRPKAKMSLDAIRSALEQAGHQVSQVSRPRVTLEELFVQIVEGNSVPAQKEREESVGNETTGKKQNSEVRKQDEGPA